MKTSKLTVAMNGTVAGTLYRNGKGAMSWQYAQTWLDTPGARVISQSHMNLTAALASPKS
ncbi:HipA N-terminal domain-containing protein [Lelliottia amnigena]|uniref:HipA N-terminal domain-containing protein n=1 Tax=Lelliottia amnigena TaxID=61646 RepID=A0ABU7UD08_LELAM